MALKESAAAAQSHAVESDESKGEQDNGRQRQQPIKARNSATLVDSDESRTESACHPLLLRGEASGIVIVASLDHSHFGRDPEAEFAGCGRTGNSEFEGHVDSDDFRDGLPLDG